jgi:two-component system, LytTR family, sensor kinase
MALRLIAILSVCAVMLLVPAIVVLRSFARKRAFSTSTQQAAFEVLHTANLASPSLRSGLSTQSMSKAAPHLLTLLGVPALSVADATGVLCWEGPGDHHRTTVSAMVASVLESGRARVAESSEVSCGRDDCAIRSALIIPILVRDEVVGALASFSAASDPGQLRLATEVARWITTQVELAELDQNRARLAQAELRALRAQISPHFIYNALTAIASFTRTDPDRARELLLEFADFTRYSLRKQGAFTTVAEELRSIERYLTLERARFGDRLQVTFKVEPESLPVAIPFLIIQPLVENAVRHGIEGRPDAGRVTIAVQEVGNDCVITVEDDGVGMDPETLRHQLAFGSEDGDHHGLANVDERLRAVYGDTHGLVIETACDAGTKVIVRVPKYRPGVRAT